jgi:HEPN domain-containing protein
MSHDKALYEARRWLETAREDWEAAGSLLESGKYSHACFFAQQSGEKAVKALWFALEEDPWGHSIQKLVMEIPELQARDWLQPVLEEAALLDRYYIPTRYPNGLPDLTPGKVYFQKDAELCLRQANVVLERVQVYLARLA